MLIGSSREYQCGFQRISRMFSPDHTEHMLNLMLIEGSLYAIETFAKLKNQQATLIR